VVKEGGSEIPTTAPKVDEWVMLADTAVPTSETYGPFVQEGDLWTCYEHSAEGALFASAYYLRAGGTIEGVAEEWIPDGEIQDAAAKTEGESGGGIDEGDSLTIVAYRFQTYTENLAIIDAVVEYGTSDGAALVSLRTAFTWEGDRWLVDFDNFGQQAVAVDSLDGYTSWRG